MSDDYLWDKSGQPDPEIQKLEEILGTLRYQPRELVIPPTIHVARRSFAYRGLAIAAVIALVALGLGVWMAVNKRTTPEVVKTETTSPQIDNSTRAATAPNEKKPGNLIATAPKVNETRRAASRRQLASASNRPRKIQPKQPELSQSEIAEARAAKDQLMLALRLASTKLNLAQKKTQGENEIHNQHKTG